MLQIFIALNLAALIGLRVWRPEPEPKPKPQPVEKPPSIDIQPAKPYSYKVYDQGGLLW